MQSSEGALLGARVGILEGSNVGIMLGMLDGRKDGLEVVGACEGSDTIGLFDGGGVTFGIAVGCAKGDDVGLMGFSVGEIDGISDVGQKVG